MVASSFVPIGNRGSADEHHTDVHFENLPLTGLGSKSFPVKFESYYSSDKPKNYGDLF